MNKLKKYSGLIECINIENHKLITKCGKTSKKSLFIEKTSNYGTSKTGFRNSILPEIRKQQKNKYSPHLLPNAYIHNKDGMVSFYKIKY